MSPFQPLLVFFVWLKTVEINNKINYKERELSAGKTLSEISSVRFLKNKIMIPSIFTF